MAADDEVSALAYTARRVRRHLRWARTEGIGRLIEEDRLDPVDRIGTALAKRRWRRRAGRTPGSAMPVYLVGLQRSGTNMLVRGLDAAPEVEVRNENDSTVFHRFQLRPDPVLTAALQRSRHAYVLVKPLCESHRVDELLALPGLTPGRALWVYRDVDDRARSEVAKFGDANLRALRAIADGSIGRRWQGQRLDADTVELIRAHDPQRVGSAQRRGAVLVRPQLAVLPARPGPAGRRAALPLRQPGRGARRAASGGSAPSSTSPTIPGCTRTSPHARRTARRATGGYRSTPRVRARCDELTDRLDRAAADARSETTKAVDSG